MITTTITASAYHVAWTDVSRLPTRCVIARHAMKQLTANRIAPSARALRCSAFPCPYWWVTSAGRTATPTVKNVSSAAIKSVPEWAASETRPRLCDARPAPSLSTINAIAATTETSAVRRCGCTRQVKQNGPPKRPILCGYEFAMSPLNCSVTPFVPLSCQWWKSRDLSGELYSKLNLQPANPCRHVKVPPGKNAAMNADVSPMHAALHVAAWLNVPPETVPVRKPRNFPCTPAVTRWPCLPVVSHAPGLCPASVTNVPLSFRVTRNVPLPAGLTVHVRLLVSVAHGLPHEP